LEVADRDRQTTKMFDLKRQTIVSGATALPKPC
jgi:hypothetical protein